MAFKLAISAGHYLFTSGKRCLKTLDPNETREWWLNDRIADRIEKLLSEYDGIEILRLDDTTGQKAIELADRAKASNNFGADFYLSIHHNAGIQGGKGGGIVAYIYNGRVSSVTPEWQKEIYNELIKLTGLKGNRSTPLAKSNLYECRVPNAPAVLLELGFMDSATDVPIILSEDYANKCAQACVNVIVKRAKLTKKVVAPTVGATYKVVTTINKYATAAEAKAKTNVKGTYAAGTYYIYNKYPNGLNGMYNISTDKTGASAGAWINPEENKVEVKEEVQKLYRVRKSKDDAKTQKGAYSTLDNAKKACQEAGAGYHVFDWDYQIVYSYTAPVQPETPKEEPKVEPTPTPTPSVTNVYDLNFPIKTRIVDPDVIQTEGIDEEDCTKAIVAIVKNNPNFNVEIAKSFFTLADEYHINPMMAISQSILETGWFKFAGSDAKASQNNFCGLGVTGGGVSGASFDTIDDGVRAQLQHLYAYGCKDALPDGETTIVDPRFKYVTRGIATYWQQLAGRWAVPGYDKNTYSTPEAAMNAENTYGQKILKICNQLENTKISEADIKKYFKTEEPKVDPVEPKDDNDLPEINKSWLTNLIKMIIEVLFDLFRSNKDK